MRRLTHKGYGRIYVSNKKDIERVKEIIKKIDEFEYHYIPEDFIAEFSEFPNLKYTHKFSDLDLDVLEAMCFINNIKIFILDNGNQEFVRNEKLENTVIGDGNAN